MGSKYRGGFSLLVPLWDDGIQFSTWRRANALAHDDGMFTLWTTPDGKCMYVCMSNGRSSLAWSKIVVAVWDTCGECKSRVLVADPSALL